jgi:sugar O-acyltransferase (sialic acid O-acetyltransferase NeuD family)
MIIAGAKGFAKEVLEVLYQNNEEGAIYFFDDVSEDIPDTLYEKFEVIKNLKRAREVLLQDNRFCLGVGRPLTRYRLVEKFTQIPGKLISVISPAARIGHYGSVIDNGCCIMTGTVITNDVKIGKGVLINLNCTIGHDSVIEEFAELSPGVHVSGHCTIGRFSSIGTNAAILPGIRIGENVIVGAGALVTKHIPDNSLVMGIPAVIKEQLPPLKQDS